MHGAYDKSITHINQIPDELLGEIFQRCRLTDDGPPSRRITALSPLDLSHVCSLWRNVILGTPHLWTHVSFSAPRNSLESLKKLLIIWVTNAKTCMLTVDIDLKTFARFKKPDDILPSIHELILLVERMRPSLLKTSVPLKVSISPQIFPYANESFDWVPSDLPLELRPQNAVNMHIVTQPCLLYGMSLHSSFGPYLVRLDLRDAEENIALQPEEAADILRAFPKLTHLALRLGKILHAFDEIIIRESHALSQLESLCLSWNNGALPEVFLCSLQAPELRHLEIDGSAMASGVLWSAILNTLRRCQVSLRSLDLYSVDCEVRNLMNALALCTRLERLWLSDVILNFDSIFTNESELQASVISMCTVSTSLRTLGVVRCELQNKLTLFASLVLSGKVWSDTRIEGLYIVDDGITYRLISAGTETSNTLHLLRSRWELGQYENLAGQVTFGNEY